jgi:hypothetical protein
MNSVNKNRLELVGRLGVSNSTSTLAEVSNEISAKGSTGTSAGSVVEFTAMRCGGGESYPAMLTGSPADE